MAGLQIIESWGSYLKRISNKCWEKIQTQRENDEKEDKEYVSACNDNLEKIASVIKARHPDSRLRLERKTLDNIEELQTLKVDGETINIDHVSRMIFYSPGKFNRALEEGIALVNSNGKDYTGPYRNHYPIF